VVAAAGDIACSPLAPNFNAGMGSASGCRQAHVSDLLLSGVHAVLALGDLQYESGVLADFEQSYALSWGRVKDWTYPVPGNHEYQTPAAAGYFDYFNGPGVASGRAGDRTKGYYAFDLGAWRLYALNSSCSGAGGCGPGSPQETWLRSDLAANPRACVLAYAHQARFASGRYVDDPAYEALWQALHEAGAEVVLGGHDHNYQRYAPLTPSGAPDPERGIRQFIVGTGGKSHYLLAPAPPAREAANDDTYGVLRLALHPSGYDWTFVPEAGRTFTDSGSDNCH
jgi:acid phosphatase type 7